MNFEFSVGNPKPDSKIVNMQIGTFDKQYEGKVFELPLPEMKRQQDKAIAGKRGVESSLRLQRKNTIVGDEVRAIYDNRNHPA